MKTTIGSLAAGLILWVGAMNADDGTTPFRQTGRATPIASSSIDATVTAPKSIGPADTDLSFFGDAEQSPDNSVCLCGTRVDGTGGCGDTEDRSCDNPACESDDDCDPGRFCATGACCEGKPKLCIGRCPDGDRCFNPGTCENGFEQCDFDPSTTCRYRDKKVKPKKGCDQCPDLRPCGVDSEEKCDDVNSCPRKFKETRVCPNGRGFCKFKSKRCGCQ